MAKYRICRACGAHLDHGEMCGCGADGLTDATDTVNADGGVLEDTEGVLMHDADGGAGADDEAPCGDDLGEAGSIAENVVLAFIKRSGCENYKCRIKMSSKDSGMCGLIALIFEFSEAAGISVKDVLADLIAVLALSITGCPGSGASGGADGGKG